MCVCVKGGMGSIKLSQNNDKTDEYTEGKIQGSLLISDTVANFPLPSPTFFDNAHFSCTLSLIINTISNFKMPYPI